MKASLVTYDNALNNRIFDSNKRDDTSKKYIILKKKLEENNIFLETYDINSQEESIFSIYFDVNKKALSQKRSPINILIARESPIINKLNNSKYYLDQFDLVMTWNRELCDQKKIFWIGYGNSSELYAKDLNLIYKRKSGNICSIISKKYSNNKYSLYKEREEAMEFFKKTNLGIDLYGYGWDLRQFRGIYRPLNKIPLAKKFLYKTPQFYKGTVEKKLKTFINYKFSLCFENCSHNGYITEKIFDSMFAGCIPVYLGCPNITQEIDPYTFINKSDFSSYKELYLYLNSMTKKEYLFRIKKIIEFYYKYIKTTHYDQVWANYICQKCICLVDSFNNKKS
ncbi:Hypothetical protein P9515_13921 [Prochlorococcus marinus str. MIT 9515]|uniref:Fucosyltransferase C-terminal domain-containing protein n=1 Tax=Prochlorococcus marinus (strain MIT 9515) TaxID=167542 RepID=A2BXT8_PROM5|nr:glycosyltransferase family 10 [Prochlorococcus marinus]ABM72599.1 Hypothetical protein P9515_13921 [Prochlorococcus marinus str. MIT 9515]